MAVVEKLPRLPTWPRVGNDGLTQPDVLETRGVGKVRVGLTTRLEAIRRRIKILESRHARATRPGRRNELRDRLDKERRRVRNTLLAFKQLTIFEERRGE